MQKLGFIHHNGQIGYRFPQIMGSNNPMKQQFNILKSKIKIEKRKELYHEKTR